MENIQLMKCFSDNLSVHQRIVVKNYCYEKSKLQTSISRGIKNEDLKTLIIISLLNILFGFRSVFCQINDIEYDPDIPRILIDWDSYEIKNSIKNGIKLINVIGQPCIGDGTEDYLSGSFKTPVVKDFDYTICTDTLFVDYSVIANCCSNFVAYIHLEESSTFELLIELHDYGEYCECNCCFNLQYVIDIKDYKRDFDIPITARLNGVYIEFEEEIINEYKLHNK